MSAAGRAPAEFLVEATEVLDVLSRDLLQLDQQHGRDPDPALVHGIFRAAHSLKGLASMFGQVELAELSHHAEDLLDRLRMGKVSLNGEVLEGLGQSVDVLQALLMEAAQGKVATASGEKAKALGQRLSKLGNAQERSFDLLLEALELGPKVREVLTEYEEHRLRENLRLGRRIFSLRMEFRMETFDQELVSLQEKLKAHGEVVSVLPGGSGHSDRISLELLFAAQGLEQVKKLVAPLGIEVSQVSKKAGPARKARPLDLEITPTPGLSLPLRTGSGAFLRPLVQTVRMDVRRLDRLGEALDQLEEIHKDLQQLAEAAAAGKAPLTLRRAGLELERHSLRLGQRLLELRQKLSEARRVPLSALFEKLSRSLRRLAAEGKKEIFLQTSGGEVELDKLMVDELFDSLIHLVRNAVAHGIELPAVRKSQGKPRRGKISFSALAREDSVVIQVSDDGAGIDHDRIREVARDRGILTPIEVLALSETERLQLLFLPGFSTASNVSSLSGRGVGLDAVKHTVERLGGRIDLTSEKGVGTTFTLTLPQ